MDNIYIRDGCLIDIVDKDWMLDKIPHADISVPIDELPGFYIILKSYSIFKLMISSFFRLKRM